LPKDGDVEVERSERQHPKQRTEHDDIAHAATTASVERAAKVITHTHRAAEFPHEFNGAKRPRDAFAQCNSISPFLVRFIST
jgi:hypothetical protein